MSTQKQTNVHVSLRLSEIIQEVTGGNVKKFSEICGVNSVTMLNYTKGRMPSSEALTNMCKRHSVNINWLLTGEGEKFIDKITEETRTITANQLVARNLSFIDDLEEWIKELAIEDPDRPGWLRIQLIESLPGFAEWIKKREQENTEIGNRRVA